MGKSRRRKRGERPAPGPAEPREPAPAARRRWPVAAVAVAAIAVVALWLGLAKSYPGAPGRPAVAPRHVEGMDPAVRALIERTLERVRASPASAEAHGTLGLVYAANQLWPEARDALAHAAELAPGDPLWRYHEALAARQAGDVDAALELLRGVVAAAPSSAPAQQRLGEALLQAGDLAGARGAYQRVIDLEPAAADGYVGVAEVLIHEGRHAEAVELLERASALEPQFRVTHYLLGLAYRGLGETEKAERHLARGLNAPRRYLSDPYSERLESYAVNLTGQLAQAGLRLRSGDAAGAVKVLEGALRDRPEEIRVINPLAMAYMQTNQLERARDLLLRAHELAGEELAVEMNLASCYLRLGQADEGLRWADAAVERAPERAQTHVARAFALDRLGRLREAAAAARRAAELDANDPRIRELAAGLEARLRAGGGG